MNSEATLLLALFIPLLSAFFIAANDDRPNWREGATLLASVLLLGVVLSLLPAVLAGARPTVDLFEFAPGLPLRLSVEPLGMTFACVAALLWPLNSLYSIGYMRGNQEQHQTRFYICFAIAIASTIGIAFAGNLLTLFIFYEALTLPTYPLVPHKGTPEAMRAGRLYLGILLSTSIGLLLLAIVWTWAIAGTLDFMPGGILAGHDRDTCRRADVHGLEVAEPDATIRQSLHLRRAVVLVERISFGPPVVSQQERHGGIHHPHVIHQEEHDVGCGR